MAATAVSVASKIPWKQILLHLPDVVKAAKGLGRIWASKPPAEVDPGASPSAQIEALAQRLTALEENEREQSQVVSQLAEQLQGVAVGLKELTVRQSRTERMLIVAIVASGIAVAGVVTMFAT